MIYLFICIGAISLIYLLLKYFNEYNQLRKDYEFLKEQDNHILSHIDAYIILIHRDFIVEKTNYYTLNKTTDTCVPKRVGDLLKCVNALESGECGTHALCQNCPIRKAINRAFDQKESFSHLEVNVNLKINESAESVTREVSISGTYFEYPQGKMWMLLTLYDITPLKETQKELILAKEKAEKAEKLKTAFLANMSHEIRTPLNAIVGFSDLLATTENQTEKNTYQQIIRNNGNILLQLINDILDLSKIEAGMMEFHPSKVKLNLLIQVLQKTVQPKASEIPIICDLPQNDFILFIDEKRLSQIFINFLNNAIKFTGKGEIHIGYQVRKEGLYCYVKDSGKGIPDDQLTKIFDRFVKLDRYAQGTGLGLAICKIIIKKFGGEIGVISEPGKGSTFWFTLPRETFSEPEDR